MKELLRVFRVFATVVAALLMIPGTSRADDIVNIDATLYGYEFPTDPAPVPGQIITPFSLAPNGRLNQRTLAAGTYRVSNATGMKGAHPAFTAWRFNSGPNWVWNFVIADDATHQVILYGEAGGIRSTQKEIAADPDVQDFSATFTLTTTTTLDFMIRDYYLPDNAGGVALLIQPLSIGFPRSHTPRRRSRKIMCKILNLRSRTE